MIVGEAGGQAEIAHFKLQLVVEEEVAQLEVPVDDPVLLDVGEGEQQLEGVVSGLQLGEDLPPFEQFVEGLSGQRTTLLVQSSRRM